VSNADAGVADVDAVGVLAALVRLSRTSPVGESKSPPTLALAPASVNRNRWLNIMDVQLRMYLCDERDSKCQAERGGMEWKGMVGEESE